MPFNAVTLAIEVYSTATAHKGVWIEEPLELQRWQRLRRRTAEDDPNKSAATEAHELNCRLRVIFQRFL